MTIPNKTGMTIERALEIVEKYKFLLGDIMIMRDGVSFDYYCRAEGFLEGWAARGEADSTIIRNWHYKKGGYGVLKEEIENLDTDVKQGE